MAAKRASQRSRKRKDASPPILSPHNVGAVDDSAIAEALSAAGVDRLAPGPRTWLYERLGRHGLDKPTMNLGGIRRSGLGECRGDVRAIETFGSIAEAAETLVCVAERAGASPDAPAPDIPTIGDVDEYGRWHAYWRFGPYRDERGRERDGWHRHPHGTPAAEGAIVVRNDETPPAPLETGWIVFFGPSDEAKKTYAQIRADWAGFEPAIAGNAKLSFLQPDVDAWRKFSRDWEISEWLPNGTVIPANELGSLLNAEVIRANRVRAEIVSAWAGKSVAPQDMPPEQKRKAIDADKATSFGRFAVKTDEWARAVPILSSITDPKLSPEQSGKRILGTVAAIIAVVAIGGIAITRRSQVVVNVNRSRP